MPGSTYTRTGPEGDPIGRLADFARFAVRELDDIYRHGHLAVYEGYPANVVEPLARLRIASRQLAAALDGYTTAADA